MSDLRGKSIALKQCRFELNGVTVAFVQNFSVSQTYQFVDVDTNDNVHRADVAFNGIKVSGSLGRVWAADSDLVAAGVLPSMAGTNTAKLQSAIDFLGKDFVVVRETDDTVICRIQNFTPTGDSANVSLGAAGAHNVAFTADQILWQSEV